MFSGSGSARLRRDSVSPEEEAAERLEDELVSFEQKLASGEAMPDGVFFEFVKRITACINEIAPPQYEDGVARRGDRDKLIMEVNKRLLGARQKNFIGRFEPLYLALAHVSDEARLGALAEASSTLEAMRVEAAILGLREDVNLKLLDLSTSALARRAVGDFSARPKEPELKRSARKAFPQ